MQEPHFSGYRKGYLLHEYRKRVLEEFQVSCPIQTVWNDDRSQQVFSKNFTQDIYVESHLVNSDEHCVHILIVPNVDVSAVDAATVSLVKQASSVNKTCAGKAGFTMLRCRNHWTNRTQDAQSLGPSPWNLLSASGIQLSFVLARLAALKTDLNSWHGQLHVCQLRGRCQLSQALLLQTQVSINKQGCTQSHYIHVRQRKKIKIE